MARDDDAMKRLYGDDAKLASRPPGGVSLVWVALVVGLGAVGLLGMAMTVMVAVRPDPVSDRLVASGALEPGETVTLMYGSELDGCLITPDAFVIWDPETTVRASLIDAELSEERFPLALIVTGDATARCVFEDDVSYGVFEELLRRGIRPSRPAWRPADPRLQRIP